MIFMLVGVQGSGKSTFAKKLAKEKGIKVISTDYVRIHNPGINEKLVWPTVYKQAYVACKQNKDVIFDATNITKKVRARFFKEVSDLGLVPEVGVYNFCEELDLCQKRVQDRNEKGEELPLPLDVVKSYYENKEEPTLDEGFKFIKKVVGGEVVSCEYSDKYKDKEKEENN